jgi:hypothetical protein
MILRTIGAAIAMSIAAVQSAGAFPVSQCETRANKPPQTAKEQAAIQKLGSLAQCQTRIDDRTACNVFLGRALELLFGNTDFKTGNDSYMLANDIASGLENTAASIGWSKIGVATDQSALDKAQAYANSGKPVVAARLGRLDGEIRHPGHVVLIIPGTAQKYDFEDVVNNKTIKFQWGKSRCSQFCELLSGSAR